MIIGSTFREAGFREYNAVRSWQLAFPGAKILLFGEETRIFAANMCVFNKEVERCPDGAPLLSDMLLKMARWSNPEEAQLWINSDIILFPGEHLQYFEQLGEPFLLTGQRWNIELREYIADEMLTLEWGKRMASVGKLMEPCGADWFCFSRGQYLDMPELAIGRTSFDNYFIYRAKKEEWLAFDMTQHVLALHQDHPESDASRNGPQALVNQALVQAAYPEWTWWAGWVNSLPAPSYSL